MCLIWLTHIIDVPDMRSDNPLLVNYLCIVDHQFMTTIAYQPPEQNWIAKKRKKQTLITKRASNWFVLIDNSIKECTRK